MNIVTNKQQGFTLIEVMVVVVILGILAAVVVPKIMDNPDKARIIKVKQDIRQLESALDLYRLDNFNYPNTDQGLEALLRAPTDLANSGNYKQGGYMRRLPIDPWGADYLYLTPGEHYEIDIYSLGSDGAPGGTGTATDIGNWNAK